VNGHDGLPDLSAARQAYEATLAELQAFEQSPPDGWNLIGSPEWERWVALKEEATKAQVLLDYVVLLRREQESRGGLAPAS
jgi:hypothetical protein